MYRSNMFIRKTSASVIVLVALTVSLQHAAQAFQVKDCAAGRDSDAKMLELDIDSCPDQSVDACVFVRGQNATMSLKFTPTKLFSQANISIYGKLGPLKIPFQFQGPKDACGNYGFECPVKPGDTDLMKFTLPVLRNYPKVPVVVRFELNDENKKPIVCFEFPVRLQ